MDGANSGHGASWPMPHVLDSALHAALHRSDIESHTHRAHRSGHIISEDREKNGRQFGSLQSAGPFPVNANSQWFFPRPADAEQAQSSVTTHQPLLELPLGANSSLENKLSPVLNTQPPSKEKAEKWISKTAFQAYLSGDNSPTEEEEHYLRDKDIFSAEHNIGIGIDANTGTQNGESFYSASYLRLKENWKLGQIARCDDKKHGDLLEKTFLNSGHQNHIIAGGQQRTCSLLRNNFDASVLPVAPEITGKLVRWTLLTPAIFPILKGENTHPGGWLPTWINPDSKEVMLKHRPTRAQGQSRKDWRKAVRDAPNIAAKLVAAMIPRAITVTGWSLGTVSVNKFGAKATHLAVPAGAVYYFQCESDEAAKQLAAALSWHGEQNTPEHIVNRRSTLLGEKGYGLGICSNWTALKQ